MFIEYGNFAPACYCKKRWLISEDTVFIINAFFTQQLDRIQNDRNTRGHIAYSRTRRFQARGVCSTHDTSRMRTAKVKQEK